MSASQFSRLDCNGLHGSAPGARCKAGVRDFSLYPLRRIVASEQLAAGIDIAAVSANLGHAHPQITLKAHAHPLPELSAAPWRQLVQYNKSRIISVY